MLQFGWTWEDRAPVESNRGLRPSAPRFNHR